MKQTIKYVITIRKQDDTIQTYVKSSKWNSDQVRSFVIRSYPIKDGLNSIKHVYIIATLDGIIPADKFRNSELPTPNKLIEFIAYGVIEGAQTVKESADHAIKWAKEENEKIKPLTSFDLIMIQSELSNFLEIEADELQAAAEFPHIFEQYEYIGTFFNGIASMNDINEYLGYVNELI